MSGGGRDVAQVDAGVEHGDKGVSEHVRMRARSSQQRYR
jgi:hypothetical protein